MIRKDLMYLMADTLGVDLAYKHGTLYGGETKKIKFGDMEIPFPVTVVSAFITDNNVVVVCSVQGDLALAVVIKDADVPTTDLLVLDASKLGCKLEGFLETFQFKTLGEIAPFLVPAVVASYHREGKGAFN